MRALPAIFLLSLLPACVMPMTPRDGSQAPSSGYETAPAPGAPASAAPSASTTASAPAAPISVSVTLRNTCRETVTVFYGDKPKYGSGTKSSLSGNSSTSKSFRPGDMIWLIDDSENGLSSVSVSATTRTIEVTASCTGFVVN